MILSQVTCDPDMIGKYSISNNFINIIIVMLLTIAKHLQLIIILLKMAPGKLSLIPCRFNGFKSINTIAMDFSLCLKIFSPIA